MSQEDKYSCVQEKFFEHQQKGASVLIDHGGPALKSNYQFSGFNTGDCLLLRLGQESIDGDNDIPNNRLKLCRLT